MSGPVGAEALPQSVRGAKALWVSAAVPGVPAPDGERWKWGGRGPAERTGTTGKGCHGLWPPPALEQGLSFSTERGKNHSREEPLV